MVKLIYCLRRQPQLTREQFQDYWLNTHGPLVRGHADVLNIRRYVQLHTAAHPLNDTLQSGRGAPEAYDGIAEIWFDDVDAITAPGTTPEGKAALREVRADEGKFIDAARSPVFMGTEHGIMEG